MIPTVDNTSRCIRECVTFRKDTDGNVLRVYKKKNIVNCAYCNVFGKSQLTISMSKCPYFEENNDRGCWFLIKSR